MATSARVGSRSARQSSSATQNIDTSNWVQVDADALPASRRDLFLRRRQAIEIYLQGAKDEEIRQKCDISLTNVYRIITKRCLAPHSDGNLYGWRGALPYVRTNGYKRKTAIQVAADGSGSGTSGALQWLFGSLQGREIEASFRAKILAKPRGLEGAKLSKQRLFLWFINQLREKGYERRGEWPFRVANTTHF